MSRVLARLGAAVVLALALGACGQPPDNSITPAAAYAAAATVTMLDVRSDAEWQAGHVRGAVHLPLADVAGRAGAVLPDRDQPIVVYCKSGGRASRAAGLLAELGYTDVRVIRNGGFPDWEAAGYPVAR